MWCGAVEIIQTRHVRADMQVRPYHFHKLDGAERLSLFDDVTFSTVPNVLMVGTQNPMKRFYILHIC